jgi:dienelactone hydrolase
LCNKGWILRSGPFFFEDVMKPLVERRGFLAASLATCVGAVPFAPLLAAPNRPPIDTSVKLQANRLVSVRLFYPRRSHGKVGFIAFSHGANSSGILYDRLLTGLADAGFVVAAPTHVDSESNPDRARFDQAAIFQTRLDDLKAVFDDAARLVSLTGVSSARFNAKSVGIAGHSYGAWQALMLAGAGCEAFGIAGGQLKDARLAFCLAISPPGSVPGMIGSQDYDGIVLPMMLTTGRRDILPGFVERWEDRLLAYHVSKAPAAALVYDDVDHYFGGLICRTNAPGPPQVRSLSATVETLALFARAYGVSDRRALARLTRQARGSNTLQFKP